MARDISKVSAVALRPTTTVPGSTPSRSPSASRQATTMSSALRSARLPRPRLASGWTSASRIASATASGVCVPPGASKCAIRCCRDEKVARRAATSRVGVSGIRGVLTARSGMPRPVRGSACPSSRTRVVARGRTRGRYRRPTSHAGGRWTRSGRGGVRRGNGTEARRRFDRTRRGGVHRGRRHGGRRHLRRARSGRVGRRRRDVRLVRDRRAGGAADHLLLRTVVGRDAVRRGHGDLPERGLRRRAARGLAQRAALARVRGHDGAVRVRLRVLRQHVPAGRAADHRPARPDHGGGARRGGPQRVQRQADRDGRGLRRRRASSASSSSSCSSR